MAVALWVATFAALSVVTAGIVDQGDIRQVREARPEGAPMDPHDVLTEQEEGVEEGCYIR